MALSPSWQQTFFFFGRAKNPKAHTMIKYNRDLTFPSVPQLYPYLETSRKWLQISYQKEISEVDDSLCLQRWTDKKFGRKKKKKGGGGEGR